MKMIAFLRPDGGSILIPCGECGARHKLSQLKPAAPSGSSPGGAPGYNKGDLRGKDGLRLLIESVPTEVAPRPA